MTNRIFTEITARVWNRHGRAMTASTENFQEEHLVKWIDA